MFVRWICSVILHTILFVAGGVFLSLLSMFIVRGYDYNKSETLGLEYLSGFPLIYKVASTAAPASFFYDRFYWNCIIWIGVVMCLWTTLAWVRRRNPLHQAESEGDKNG